MPTSWEGHCEVFRRRFRVEWYSKNLYNETEGVQRLKILPASILLLVPLFFVNRFILAWVLMALVRTRWTGTC